MAAATMSDVIDSQRGAAWLRTELDRKARLARSEVATLRKLFPNDQEMQRAADYYARACEAAAKAYEAALDGVRA